MNDKKRHKGSIMLEALLAIALSSLFFTAATGLILAATQTVESSFTEEEVRWLAEESLSALREVDFAELTIGNNKSLFYNAVSDRWEVGTNGPETLANGMTRTLEVAEVLRDENCAIVTSGGTPDPDSYYLRSTLTWNSLRNVERNYASETLRIRWDDPQGDCFRPTQAGSITVNTDLAYWGGAKQLRDIFVINDTGTDATIVKMTLTWDVPGSELQQIFLAEGKIWSDSGPGSPSGTQPSGTEIDTVDITIPAYEDGEAYKIQFTSAMSGATLTVHFEFADGSTLTTDPFTPSG